MKFYPSKIVFSVDQRDRKDQLIFLTKERSNLFVDKD